MDMTHSYDVKRSCDGLLVAACLLCALIVFTANDTHISNTDFHEIIDSYDFVMSVVVGLVLSVPMMVDALMDFYAVPSGKVSQLILCVSLLIPNALKLYAIQSEHISRLVVFAYATEYTARSVALVKSILSFEYTSPYRLVGFALTCMHVITDCTVISLYWTSWQSTTGFAVLLSLGIVIAGALIAFCCVLLYESYKEASHDAQFSVLYILSLLSHLALTRILYFSHGGKIHSSDLTVTGAVVMQYVASVVTVLTVIVPNRISMSFAQHFDTQFSRKLDFVRYVSHELRSPLNAISVGLYVLSQEFSKLSLSPVRGSTIGAVVDDVVKSCDSAVSILDDLLTFNQIENDALELKMSRLSVVKLIRNAISPYQRVAFEKGVVLNIDQHMDEELGDNTVVFADKVRITNVIGKLAANAIEFTPEGKTVVVKAHVLRPAEVNSSAFAPDISSNSRREYVRIDFIDSSPGIKEDKQCNLFIESGQFSPVDFQSGLGTGLGLWVSKVVMESHRGRIGVRSKVPTDVGKAILSAEETGSVFYIDLEMAHDCNPDHQSVTSLDSDSQKLSFSVHVPPSPSPINTHRSHPGAVIPVSASVLEDDTPAPKPKWGRGLIVDDVATNRKMLGRIVRSRFEDLDYAVNGQEAVDRVQATVLEDVDISTCQPYGVIFMDCNMPIMDGMTATRNIRKLGYKGVILGVTGNGLQEDIDMFLESGVDRVLIKPLNIKKFEQALNSIEASNLSDPALLRKVTRSNSNSNFQVDMVL